MNKLDYLDISNINQIENFSNGSGSIGNTPFGAGSITNSNGKRTSSSTASSSGGKLYGSYDLASVLPSGAMSGLSNVQPNSISALGEIKTKGAKIGTFTGGSFGGYGKEVVGFPGIKAGSTLPAISSPSLYIKPEITSPNPKFFSHRIIPKETLPYGKIEHKINNHTPKPIITNKYDNVGCNFATKLRGPKFPFGVDLKNENLTGFYGNQGAGYFLNNFYWGLGPWYPITGVQLNYPDIPFNYEDLMQKRVNTDYMINTIQNQLATQYAKQELDNINKKNKEQEEKNENMILSNAPNDKTDIKENFDLDNKNKNKNTVIIVMAVILIIYILFSVPITNTEKSFHF